jgi:hypothetical protein
MAFRKHREYEKRKEAQKTCFSRCESPSNSDDFGVAAAKQQKETYVEKRAFRLGEVLVFSIHK